MIKRNTRNIGKMVVIENYHKDWNGRHGKVVGFRGDLTKGNPQVNVFVESLGAVWTIPGSFLTPTKEKNYEL